MNSTVRRPMIAFCRTLTGNGDCAILLHRMNWYSARAIIEKDSKLYYAKARANLIEETGLSLHQYKQALTRLKALGFVETRHVRYGGDAITGFRVTEKFLAELKKHHPAGGTEAPAGWGYTSTNLKKEQDSKNKTKGQDLATSVANPEPEEKNEEGNSGKENPKSELTVIQGGLLEEAMKAKDPVLQTETKPKPGPKNVVGALRDAWCSGLAQHHHGTVPPLTAKQFGQLKSFESRTPKHKAAAILPWAVEHWDKFRSLAEEEAGAFKTPKSPQIWFLLKYVAVAIAGEAAAVSGPKYKSKVKIGGM